MYEKVHYFTSSTVETGITCNEKDLNHFALIMLFYIPQYILQALNFACTHILIDVSPKDLISIFQVVMEVRSEKLLV